MTDLIDINIHDKEYLQRRIDSILKNIKTCKENIVDLTNEIEMITAIKQNYVNKLEELTWLLSKYKEEIKRLKHD